MKTVFVLLSVLVGTVAVYAQQGDPNEIILRGRVLNDQGKPVSGAQIEIYDFPEKKYVPYSANHAGTVTTNTEGVYVFSRSRGFLDSIYSTIAIIHADGYAIHCFDYTEVKKESPVILSPKRGSISGQVVDSQGQPISDVAVSVFMKKAIDILTTDIPLFTRQTNAEGRFTFDDLSLADNVEFYAIKKGYAGTYTFRTDEDLRGCTYSIGRRDVRLVLKREASFAGQLIRTDSGLPLAGETISVHRHQGANGIPLYMRDAGGEITVYRSLSPKDICTLQTDEQGQFFADAMVPGVYTVFHHNYLEGLFSPKLKITVEEGQHLEFRIEAVAGVDVTIKGSMEDGAIPGQDVLVAMKQQKTDDLADYLAFWKIGETARCNSQGQFQFNVLAGCYEVSCISKTAELTVENPVIQVPSATYPELIFKYKQEQPQPQGIRGLCMDSEGSPLANVKVYLLSDPNHAVYTDSQGGFVLQPSREECKKNVMWKYLDNKQRHETNPSLTALRLEAEYGPFFQDSDTDWLSMDAYLVAEGAGAVALHQFYSHRDVFRIPGPEPVTLILKPAYHIIGRAVAAENRPVPGALVEVFMAGYHFDPERRYKETITDEKGTFSVQGLVMNTNYMVRLTTPEGVCCVKHFSSGLRKNGNKGVELYYAKEAGLVDMGDFSLNPELFEVSGVVTNLLGRPVSNARLTLNAPAQDIKLAAVTTGKDGLFSFSGIFAGPVELRCNAGEKGYEFFETTAGTKHIRIIIDKGLSEEHLGETLIPSAAIELSFIDKHTRDPIILPSAYVYITQENGNSFYVHLNSEGKARFLMNPGRVQFALYGMDDAYQSLKKEFVTELYQAYAFQYEVETTEKQKVIAATGPVVYPEVFSEAGNTWNMKIPRGSGYVRRLLEVSVRDVATGMPVPGAEILISFTIDTNGKGRFLGKTNDSGKVSFVVDTIVNCTLTSVAAPGYIEKHPETKISTGMLDVTRHEISIEQKPSTVHVTVLDMEGKPAPNVWLYHEYYSGDKWERVFGRENNTDKNGQLEMGWRDERGSEPQIEHFISMYNDYPDKKEFIAQVVKAMPGEKITLRMIRPIQVQGRILDAGGNGIANQSFNFDFLINNKTIGGPYIKTREDGSYGPLCIAPGYHYQIHIDRDRVGKFGQTTDVFIADSESCVQLPDCVFSKK